MSSSIFWDVVPCSQAEMYRCFGGMYWLHLQGRRLSQDNEVEALRSTEMSAYLYQTTRRNIPKGSALLCSMINFTTHRPKTVWPTSRMTALIGGYGLNIWDQLTSFVHHNFLFNV
jgi:hypothetical protein